jgi:periplasmic protein TonB
MRRDLIIGLLAALTIHAGVAYLSEVVGNGKSAVKAKPPAATIELIEMPKMEPDEPEVVDENQQKQPPQDFAPPMLNDVPQLVTDTSFVQKLQPPLPDNLAVNKSALTIPENTGNWAKGIGQVFDISKLDKIPQATVQVRPQYPFEMRRAGISGQVLVEFIVDTSGNVQNAFAASSTQREFESAAVQAVSKWKFRPGQRGGRAVNTRMQVPIVFSLNSEE